MSSPHLLTIFGHETQRQSLAKLYTKQVLPSTLLFAGPEGVGKKLAAEELARSLLCKSEAMYGGCGTCSSCALFDAHNHPDFYKVSCGDKDRWGTDGVKGLLHSLSLTSFGGSGRVIIFDEAEELHPASSNALLKSLEEPRPKTWFILVTSNPSKLPSTIRSRSQVWFFNPLSPADTELAVTQLKVEGLGEFSTAELAVLTDGAPGRVSRFLEHRELWDEIKRFLPLIVEGDIHEAARAAQKLSKDKEVLPVVLSFIRAYARNAMEKAGDALLQDARWATCVANAITAERLIFERNLNAQTTLLSLFMNLGPQPGPQFTEKQIHGTLLDDLVIS